MSRSRVLDFKTKLNPSGTTFDQMRSCLLRISFRINLLFHRSRQLRNDVILILDNLLLANEEETRFENIEEETEMHKGLTYAVISQLCATFQDFMDAVGVG